MPTGYGKNTTPVILKSSLEIHGKIHGQLNNRYRSSGVAEKLHDATNCIKILWRHFLYDSSWREPEDSFSVTAKPLVILKEQLIQDI